MCFLLSLVDHEEIGELDLSDLVSNNTSVFAKLLSNEESMKVMLLIVITQWEVNNRHCGKQLNCSPIPCGPNFIYHHRNITFLIRHVMRIKRTINKGIPSIRHETKFSK